MKANTLTTTTLFRAGLLVGFLDGMAAVIQTILNHGDPVKVFQFIASGVFGAKALAGGDAMAMAGVLFHFAIAFTWTLIFFLIYPRLKLLSWNWVITGIVYGLVIWVGMNLIVVPLSNIGMRTITLRGFLISSSILMVAIGLPLSFLANRHYRSARK
ncbi:MAG TPA: hypothetical protein VFE57_08960 [Cyclobacteriaceae bacterium]|jgi:hypothetical protein|nr:hypothetical protein [Cyclobacteriaceae bacterium]